MTRTVLISGSGSGMGLLTAQTLIRRGHSVFAGIRDPETRSLGRADDLRAYAQSHGKTVEIVDLDIASEESCQAAVDAVIAKDGRIDVVVHNAAHLYSGASEAFTPDQLHDSLNVNAIGAHRLNRAALPRMRAQGSGLLLYNGSAVTRILVPFTAPYIMAKAAFDVLAEATAMEVGAFGIDTSIVMPGVFVDGTEHFGSAVSPGDEEIAGVYDDKFKDGLATYEEGFRKLIRGDAPVQGVADEIVRIIELDQGDRPLRSVVDYSDYGTEAVNAVADAQSRRVLKIMGYEHLIPA